MPASTPEDYIGVIDPDQQITLLGIIDGTISSADKELVQALLGRFGLNTAVIDTTGRRLLGIQDDKPTAPPQRGTTPQHEDIDEHGYSISDIVSPEHVLLREHIEDLVGRTVRDPHSGLAGVRDASSLAGHIFNILINGGQQEQLHEVNLDGEGNSWMQVREPKPLDGLTVISRKAWGFEPYIGAEELPTIKSRILANYGVTVASMGHKNLARMIGERKSKASEEILMRLGNIITNQVNWHLS